MPFLILEITRLTNYAGAFSWVLLIFAVISLISYVFMKEKKQPLLQLIHTGASEQQNNLTELTMKYLKTLTQSKYFYY